MPKTKCSPLCAYCLKPMLFAPADKRIDHILHEYDSQIRLQWHDDRSKLADGEKTCADKCEILQAIADADGHIETTDDGTRKMVTHTVEETEQIIVDQIAALHRRVLSSTGAHALPGVFQVKKDYGDMRVTLRGPGESWGLPSLRSMPGAIIVRRRH